MRWHVLWASLVASILLAVGFVKLILMAGMKQQLELILPVLPLFYTVVFPLMDKTIPEEGPRRQSQKAAARAPRRWSGALNPILLGLGVGLALNLLLDLVCGLAYRRFVLASGPTGLEPLTPAAVLGWFFGELPYSGVERLVIQALEMVVVSACAGVCVGLLSKTRPLLNGLIAGAIYAAWSGTNQYASVYETILGLSARLGDGWPGLQGRWNYGLLVALFLQVLLCAVCSGLAFRAPARPAASR